MQLVTPNLVDAAKMESKPKKHKFIKKASLKKEKPKRKSSSDKIKSMYGKKDG